MIRLTMPGSGVIVSVTPEKAEKLGWPPADDAAQASSEPVGDAPAKPRRQRSATK